MSDEPVDQSSAYCTTTPHPGTFMTAALLGRPCPDCGHATALHIGVDHCPVCELLDHNERARTAAVEPLLLAATEPPPVDTEDLPLAEQAWVAIQQRFVEAEQRRLAATQSFPRL